MEKDATLIRNLESAGRQPSEPAPRYCAETSSVDHIAVFGSETHLGSELGTGVYIPGSDSEPNPTTVVGNQGGAAKPPGGYRKGGRTVAGVACERRPLSLPYPAISRLLWWQARGRGGVAFRPRGASR
jgi:hypothetical protein